jgi:hypothetical protein
MPWDEVKYRSDVRIFGKKSRLCPIPTVEHPMSLSEGLHALLFGSNPQKVRTNFVQQGQPSITFDSGALGRCIS